MSVVWLVMAIIQDKGVPALMFIIFLALFILSFAMQDQVDNHNQVQKLAQNHLKELDEETAKLWTEDDEGIQEAFIDFHYKLKQIGL